MRRIGVLMAHPEGDPEFQAYIAAFREGLQKLGWIEGHNIKIGLDAVNRLHAKPRELTVLYYDSDASPCACFADGIAIATQASVGQRTLSIAPDKAPPGDAAVIVIRPRTGGPGFKYTIPINSLGKLGQMNKDLDLRGRYDAVMAAEGLFEVQPAQ